MKAKLIFNLPEDLDDYTMANNANDYWCTLWDFNAYIHAIYNGKKEEPTVAELCRMWFETLEDHGIDVYEIS